MSEHPAATETEPADTDERRTRVEFVHVKLGDTAYKFELGQIRQVVRNPSLTPVPQTGPIIAGLTNLGSEIVVVIEGRSLFDMAPRPADADAILLVFDRPNAKPTGLLVDAVPGIDPHHIDQITPPAELDEWDPQVDTEWFQAVIDEPDQQAQPIGVLDCESIITTVREQV